MKPIDILSFRFYEGSGVQVDFTELPITFCIPADLIHFDDVWLFIREMKQGSTFSGGALFIQRNYITAELS